MQAAAATGPLHAATPPAAAAAAPALDQVTKSKRASAQNVSNVIALVKNGHNDHEEDDAPRAAASASVSPRPAAADAGDVAAAGRGATPAAAAAAARATPAAEPPAAAAAAAAGAPCRYPGHEGVAFDDELVDVMTWRPDDGTLGLLYHGPEKDYSDAYTCGLPPCL